MEEVAYQAALRIFRRHEQRRRDGLPTVSLLVANDSDALGFARALERAGYRCLASRAREPNELAREWLSELDDVRDVLDAAFAFVAGALGVTEAELRAAWSARSDAERKRWLEQRAGHATPELRAALDTLHSAITTEQDPLAQLRALFAWLPERHHFVLSLAGAQASALQAALALAARAPDWPLLAVVPPEQWPALHRQFDARSRSLLELGMLPELPAQPTDTSRPTAADVGVALPRASGPAAAGTPNALELQQRAAEAAAEARTARASQAPEADLLERRARSLAEQRLFELLEAEPATAGRFTLNQRLPFSFGTQAAEVDLVCAELGLAIEVDGYHHFQELDAYRRDRRKDAAAPRLPGEPAPRERRGRARRRRRESDPRARAAPPACTAERGSAMTQAEPSIDPQVAQQLVLARLCVRVKKPLSRREFEAIVAKAIGLPQPLARASAQAAIEACELSGYVTTQPDASAGSRSRALRLTPAGERALAAFIARDPLPSKITWERWQQYIALAAVGQRGLAGDRIDADHFVALVLSARHGLPSSTKSPAKAVDRLCWRALGVERATPFSLQAVQRYLLRDIVPEGSRVSPENWRRMLAMRALGAERPDAKSLLRAALLHRPHGKSEAQAGVGHNDNAAADSGASLADFARAVREAAAWPEVAHFHDDRAFIGSVWQHMRERSGLGMSLDTFKARLIEAHRERLLRITRADLVSAMDPAEVERSEARFQDATFHFVALDAGGSR